MRIVNVDRGVVLADQAVLASSFWRRLVGLMGRERLVGGTGLILRPCNSIHTCFMRFPIDVIFLDSHGRVTKLIPELAPFRFSPLVLRSSLAIELPAGTIRCTATELRDLVALGD